MSRTEQQFLRPRRLYRRTRAAAVTAALAVVISFLVPWTTVPAQGAVVGSGFTVTAGDLSYILKQIRIAERHSATLTPGNPCGTLVGTAPNQVPTVRTLWGLRTVDGSCNNLVAGRETFGSADQPFPRLTNPKFLDAEGAPAGLGGQASSSYTQKKGPVFDSRPRTVSNLIVDQTSTNPAAVAAASFPVRTQGNPGNFPCTTDPDPNTNPPTAGVPSGCVPSHQTLFIPNVTTDVGLSPPYNSVFTFFGQFFDHGIDQTVKGGGTAFVPMKADDPLIAGPDHIFGNGDDLDPNLRFMVMTRALNQPGPDGVIGDDPDTQGTDESADDVQNANNTDSPWVDQSQTYSSHASHQVFLRDYAPGAGGVPEATGKLIQSNGTGMATWATVKEQAATELGLLLEDKDATNVPMLATNPYGEFIPGPNGLPQYVTTTGLEEGDLTDPVPVPENVRYFDTPFLTDIAHNADPSAGKTKDTDTVASTDFANQPAGTYDDEMLDLHFIAGDGRVNENIALTAVHQVFHSEHNRLVGDIESILTANPTLRTAYEAVNPTATDPTQRTSKYGDRIFQAARFITEMEYQHLVFEEFGRKMQPEIHPFNGYQPDVNAAVDAEFAHAVYRFGHSMLNDTVARTNPDGSDNSQPLLTAFLNPPAYYDDGSGGTLTPEEAAGSIFMGSSDQIGNELDEFVTETLRNNLLGLPLDLATLNLARARDAGIPSLNDVRRQIHAETNDGQLQPYENWSDFGQHLKHPESLVNFVAAYGTHPTITSEDTMAGKRAAAKAIVDPGSEPATDPADIPADAAAFMFSTPSADLNACQEQGADCSNWSSNANGATITGLDEVDLWIGGLAEVTNNFGGLLGNTFNYVFQTQMEKLQDGDRFYYLGRLPGMNLRAELESNSFAEMVHRNTEGANTLKADVFATADCKFQLANLNGTPAGFNQFGGTVADDPSTECNENALLLRQPNGTIQYRATNSVDPPGVNGQAVYNGTPGVDRVRGGNDNDTFWGGAERDWIDGNGGDDVVLGGLDNDIITDASGADVLKGGPGHDAMDSGAGLDINMGGPGQDFINGGAGDNESFGGEGNDFIIAGVGIDMVFGDGGDDWIQGGTGADLLQGDHGAPFFDDPAEAAPGNDVFVGQDGENDYDAEGGDDVMAGNLTVDRFAGLGGFDWAIHQYNTVPADDDMSRNNPNDVLPVDVLRDRWQESEAVSGWTFNDTIRGDDLIPRDVAGGGFTGCDALDQAGLDRIAGLDAIVPALTGDASTLAANSPTGTCPLTGPVWGDGNILLGGAGNDLIEGRGADDVIDGDKALTVRISVRTNPANPATEIGSTTMMERAAVTGTFGPNTAGETLQKAVFDGDVDPGNLVIVREIVDPPASDSNSVDTAQFSGARGGYTLVFADGVLTVTDTTGTDGVDTLRNIEKLQFTDQTLDISTPPSAPVIGTATAGDGEATVNWNPGPANGSAPLNQFQIQVLVGGTVVRTVTGIPPLDTSADVINLTNGTSYTFRVVAVNQFGRSSAPSAPSNAVTPDTPGPRVTTSTPLDNATGVAVGADVTATFNKPVSSPNWNVAARLRNNSTGTNVASAVNYNPATQTVTNNPNANLAPNTSYTLTLLGTGANGIRDAAGARITTTTVDFTTAGDSTAPTVTSTTPADNATGVAPGANVLVNFSERVLGANAGNVVLRNQISNAIIARAVSINGAGTRVTINPNANLARNTVFQVTLTGGTTAIRDAAGNALTTQSFSFTTR